MHTEGGQHVSIQTLISHPRPLLETTKKSRLTEHVGTLGPSRVETQTQPSPPPFASTRFCARVPGSWLSQYPVCL